VEETIPKEDGLLSKANLLITEDPAAFPDDSLLKSGVNFPALKSNGQRTAPGRTSAQIAVKAPP